MQPDGTWPPSTTGDPGLRRVRPGGGGRGLRRFIRPGTGSGVVRLALALFLNISTVLALAGEGPVDQPDAAHLVQAIVLLCYALVLAWRERHELFSPGFSGFFRAALKPHRLVTLLTLALAWWWPALAVGGALLLLLHLWGAYVWLLQRNVNPSLVFVGSFAALILAGTVALKLPAATPPERPISWLDAAFTSTSAACVTGLVINDTPTHFTRFGHIVILTLIQLGGLGVILFGSMVALLLGSSISLKAVHAMTDTTHHGVATAQSVRRLVIFTGVVVFGLEALGAIALFFGWPGSGEWASAPAGIDDPANRAFHAAFFAVSAFCNAGFATTSDNLQALRLHWTTHIVIALLIVTGALGLPVFANVAQIIRAKIKGRRRRSTGALIRLSLHTKIVVVVTVWVHVIGAAGILLSEWFHRSEPWQARVLDANFMSITGTAGFITTQPALMGPFARLSLMFSMFVGGSPSSVAGGIKTVVFGILAVTVWTAVSSRESVHLFRRRIPEELVRKSVALFVLHLLLITAITGVLLFTEKDSPSVPQDIGLFEAALFEAISACSTAGLTLGITPGVSAGGKIAIICGMFVGRVGSLAFLVSLVGFAAKRRPRYMYPAEGVVLS